MKYATLKTWSGKLVIMALVLCMVISMTACGKNADEDSGKETTGVTETTEATTEATTDATEPSENQETTAPTEEPAPPAETEAPTVPTETVVEKVYVTMYANGRVNYRTGPGTTYEKKGSLTRGDAVQVVKDSLTENGWYEAQIDGEECYLYGAYLSATKPSEDSSSTSKDEASSGTNSGSSSSESTGSAGNGSTGSSDSSGSSGTSGSGSNGAGSSSGDSSASGGSTSNTSGVCVCAADTATGISWDGVSPIIYTYTDGTTGTVPKDGATYETLPGVTSTYREYQSSVDEYWVDGKPICYLCGKVAGDGSNDTCKRWLAGSDHTCSNCGATVPTGVCHTCDEE